MAHVTRPLPQRLRPTDNRPVWEPPALDYSWLIDRELCEKHRKALLEWFNNDVERVTRQIDLETETNLSYQYGWWVQEVLKQLEETALHSDQEQWKFWLGLQRELQLDRGGFDEDDPDSRIVMLRGEDGSLTVWDHKGDELERAIFGSRDSDSVHGEGSGEHVAHFSVPSLQEDTLSEHPESENSEDGEDDTGRPQGAGSSENLVQSTSQSLQKNTQSAAATELTRLLQTANVSEESGSGLLSAVSCGCVCS